MINFRTDEPKEIRKEDHFQRYDFSKRIAEIVSSHRGEKSLVVGIYGKWGEGKSSVLNFIKSELSDNALPIFFNPWLYSDERHLLNSFFSTVAIALDENLESRKEKIGKFLSEYAGILGVVTQFAGASTDGLKDLGSKLNSVPLEAVKNKISSLLLQSEKSIVVFMDDIDRLDVNEIQSVFRLVKLTGDFPNMVYILAFDEEMVAEALSEKYPSKKQESGYLYLEKIIQVPLKLPKANINALRTYTLNLLDSSIKSCQISLNEQEVSDFLQIFDNNFVSQIKNPRLAVRYANSLTFSLPLLKGEIYVPDLITIEGLKIFYPKLYDFIRSNPSLFLINREYSENNEKVKESLNEFLGIYYSEKDREKLIELLANIFPRLNSIYKNFHLGTDSTKKWNKEKRISSVYHFERYFSYTVQEGDISDVFFQELLFEFEKLNNNKALDMLRLAFQKYKPHELIFKFRLWEGELSDNQCQNIVAILSNFGSSLPKEDDFHFATTYAQAASTIAHFFFFIEVKLRLDVLTKALKAADDFGFALEIAYSVFQRNRSLKQETKLSTKEEQEIEKTLLNRWLIYLNKDNFFGLVQDIDLQRLLMWWKKYDERSFSERIVSEIRRNSNCPLMLLKVFASSTTSFSSSGPSETYKTGFFQQQYDFMKSLFDPSFLFIKLKKQFNHINIENMDFSGASDRDKIDDDTLVGMFFKIHFDSMNKV